MFWTRSYIDDDRRCSFCRKTENEVGELICSPSKPVRYICAGCVTVCVGILQQRSGAIPAEPGAEEHRLIPGKPVIVKYRVEREDSTSS